MSDVSVTSVHDGVLVGVGGTSFVLPHLSPEEAADLAAGLIRVTAGEDVLAGLTACVEVGADGAAESLSPGVAAAVDQVLGRWLL